MRRLITRVGYKVSEVRHQCRAANEGSMAGRSNFITTVSDARGGGGEVGGSSTCVLRN